MIISKIRGCITNIHYILYNSSMSVFKKSVPEFQNKKTDDFTRTI